MVESNTLLSSLSVSALNADPAGASVAIVGPDFDVDSRDYDFTVREITKGARSANLILHAEAFNPAAQVLISEVCHQCPGGLLGKKRKFGFGAQEANGCSKSQTALIAIAVIF